MTAPPLPARKPKILNGVADNEIKSMIRGFEYDVSHFYKDTEGNVTIGTGKRVPTAAGALQLPLSLLGQNKTIMRPATPEEIGNDYWRVQRMQYGKNMNAEAFKLPKDTDQSYIGLDPFSSDALLERELRNNAQELRKKFSGFDRFPPSAQKALLDMQYNLGGYKFRERYIDGDGIEKGWPKLFRAVRNGDWEKAAWESHRTGIGEDRNKWTGQSFFEARKK